MKQEPTAARRTTALLVLALALASALAAATDPADESCLKCHNAAKLASLKLNGKRGPEVIPEDPVEGEAFATVINEAGAHRRRELAEAFLKTYPASWMLEPAYEIAAKASIATGDFPAALAYGARSLRLLPENPFLLVALADAQTRMGKFEGAARSATDALGFLDRFDRPSSIDEATWPRVKAQLQSQAYFAIGRAAAEAGMASGSKVRATELGDAEKALRESFRLSPSSAGSALLLGLVDLNQNRMEEGAGFMAMAARIDGPLPAQAVGRLRAVYADGSIAGGRPFE
jgi:tetratricopeptide (TPR) repeat protein